MYGNDNYSGFGTGDQTTGAFSGAQSSFTTGSTSAENSFSTEGNNSAENRATSCNAYNFNSTQNSSASQDAAGSSGATPYFNTINSTTNASSADSTASQADRMSLGTGDSTQREGNCTSNNYNTYQMGGNSNEENKEPKKEKQHKEKKSGGYFHKAILAMSLGLFFGLFAGLGFYAVWQGTGLMNQKDEQQAMIDEVSKSNEAQSGIKLANTNSVTVIDSDISGVVDEVMPAMVSIVNNYTESGSFWGQTYTQQAASSGSGIIVAENDTELLIVSNNHVVVDSDQLVVTFIDGSEAEAHIKGLDSDMDLAVIAVSLEDLSEETKAAISVAALGDSDNLKLGEPVIAIGNALGYGQSVTTGIVSALNREITMEDGSTGTFIQTDAAINPGNSGGALLNVNGEVIGINSNKIGGTAIEGMGYAIPITSASPIIADLMERQTRNKVDEDQVGYMGISMQEVTEQASLMYNMPEGIYVYEVQEGSAAQAAGIMRGDIITKFDGEKITSYEDLQSVLQYYAAGNSATVTVMRPENGQYVQYDLSITLGERPKDAN